MPLMQHLQTLETLETLPVSIAMPRHAAIDRHPRQECGMVRSMLVAGSIAAGLLAVWAVLLFVAP